MQQYINNLADKLQLSQYQSNKLKTNYDLYNVARLQKRGGVLFAPYATRGPIEWINKILFGRRADLIGKNHMLLRAQRNIKFCANGYHCVRVGKHTYYADAMGNVVSRNEFLKNTQN